MSEQFLSLEKLVALYGLSKPTIHKIKKNADQHGLKVSESRPVRILNIPENHQVFENILTQRKGKYSKTKIVEVDWSPVTDTSNIFTLLVQLYSEIDQNRTIPIHIHHQSTQVMEILHEVDTAYFNEINEKNKYINLLKTTFEKIIGKIRDEKIDNINIADLSFQLGYVWPILYGALFKKKKANKQIQKYIDIDMSPIRLQQFVSKTHPQVTNWPQEAKDKIYADANSSLEENNNNLSFKVDLLRDLWQKEVFSTENNTSTIHFISANHLYSRSEKDGERLLNNARRSMDKKDWLILIFKTPQNIEKIKQKFLGITRENKVHTFTLENVLKVDKFDYSEVAENTKYGFKVYAQLLKNLKIHFGSFENSYGKLKIARDLVLLKNEKVLLTQRNYYTKQEIEKKLIELGLEIAYYDFDNVLEMGVFGCKVGSW